MAINSSTYLSETTLFIRDLLISNVTDPNSSIRNSSNKFVMTSYPKRGVTYPMITVVSPGMQSSKRLGLRSQGMYGYVPVEIRVWARDMKEKDSITQDVEDSLRTVQLTASTGTVANDLFGFNIVSSTDVDEVDGDGSGIAIKSKVINVEYFVILT
jgi:hypothetical protein